MKAQKSTLKKILGRNKNCEIGKKYDLLVLCAYELRFDENPNDYLVYGMTEEFTRNFTSIFTMGVKVFSNVARDNGFLLYQAHMKYI